MKIARLMWLFGIAALGVGSIVASAQVIPPIFGGSAAFAPQIGIVHTGVLADMQGTVSADRKYVTIGAQPQNASLLALREFAFNNPGGGLVGGVGSGTGTNAKVNARRPAGHSAAQASEIATPPLTGQYGRINRPVALTAGAGSVLFQRGMTRLVSPN